MENANENKNPNLSNGNTERSGENGIASASASSSSGGCAEPQFSAGSSQASGTIENVPHIPAQQPKTRKKRGCLFAFLIAFCLIFVLVILFFLISVSIFFITVTGTEKISSLSILPQYYHKNFNEILISGLASSPNKILVIDVSGVITSYYDSIYKTSDAQTICEMLEQANRDDSVKAIILRIDSPGGEVTAADKIHNKICEVRKNKPIVVSMEAIATSGGYYIAAPTDWIVANRLTLTGSIGVVIQTYNYHNLLGKIGVYTETFKSGPMKDMLDGSKVTTEAEKEIIQKLVIQVYDEFAKIVAKGRSTKGITIEKIKNTEVGDGRVISGEDALRYGLVDQLGYFEDSVKKSAELAMIGDNYKLVYYMKHISLLDLFSQIKGPENAKISVEIPGGQKNWANLIEPGKIYLLPTKW